MSAPAKPRRRIKSSTLTTVFTPPAGLRVIDVTNIKSSTRVVPSRDCGTSGVQVEGHAISVDFIEMAVGGYLRSSCSCGEFTSRPCGTEEVAAQKAERHLIEIARHQQNG